MNKILITLLALFISLACIANNGDKDNKQSRRKQNRMRMQEKIMQLKDGALLVRLKTKAPSIAALREIGKIKSAAKMERKQRAYNIKIIEGFKINFTFCPTYFFYSDYSENVAEKQFDKVVFLNDNLDADTNIKFTGQKFLTAEFGNIEQDTAIYFKDFYLYSDENGLDRKKAYNGSSDMGFGAIVIKSDGFVQLRRPFRYYTRTFEALPVIKRKPEKVIKRMNNKLLKYYKKTAVVNV